MMCPIISYRERSYGNKDCQSNCAWKDKESGRCLIALTLEANLKSQKKEMTFSDYANMILMDTAGNPIKEGDYIKL